MDITVIGRGNVAKGTVQKENAHWAFLIQHLVHIYRTYLKFLSGWLKVSRAAKLSPFRKQKSLKLRLSIKFAFVLLDSST